MHIRPKLLVLLTAVATGTSLAACGSSSGQTESRASATLQPAAATESFDAAATAKRPKLKIASSDYGRILFNGRGRALYLFTADTGDQQLLRRLRHRLASVHRQGEARRRPRCEARPDRHHASQRRQAPGDLRQPPHLLLPGDNDPGEVLCQAVYEFGGYWYVLRGNGKAVH